MARTVVIIHPGALGDVLLAVPAMKRIRGSFPQHKSLLLASAPVGRLLFDCQLIDAWMSVQGAAGAELFTGSVPVSGELHCWLESCDLAVVWTQDTKGALATLLQNCGVREVRIQSPFCRELKATHQSDRFLEILGKPAMDLSIDRCEWVTSHLVERGRSYLERVGILADRPLVIVHPGSGSRAKCSDAMVLASAIEQLRQDGDHPFLIEGPADEDAVASLLKLTSVKPTVLRGLDLSLLAGVIAQAELYIGHDSGVTHLSALLGVPTIALFGPTDPERWAPRGDHVIVLRGARCRCGSWEAVRICAEKSCLAIPVEELISSCRAHRSNNVTLRNL